MSKMKTCNSCLVEYKVVSSFAIAECIDEQYCPFCGRDADLDSNDEDYEDYEDDDDY